MEALIKDNKAWIDETWQKLEKKMYWVREKSHEKIPYTTIDGVHDNWIDIRISRWTNGFWPGMMWLMYVATKDEKYRETAEFAEKALDKALFDIESLCHDVGFMWQISSGVNYRLFGGGESRNRLLTAAAALFSRYNLKGEYIRAWNREEGMGYAIIDCMMNLPILYLASELTGDPRFGYVAQSHADTTMNHQIRKDGSVYHVMEYDPYSGQPLGTPDKTQGYDPETSAWSRGQAWAVYGFVLSYLHTKKKEYLDTAKITANYFIANVCDDYVPKCDFRAPKEPVYYDTTAGACAACGLLEIAKCVPEFEKKMYFDAAIKMLKAIEKDHCDWTLEEQSIVQNGSEAYHNAGHNMPIIYGDYYFIEALYKLRGNELLFW